LFCGFNPFFGIMHIIQTGPALPRSMIR
jgi:hypothetical protein